MLRTLTLFAALTMTSLPAFAAEDAAKPDPKASHLQIKVFRLKVAEPEDALQAFNALIGSNPDHRPQSRTPDITPTLPPLPAPPQAPAQGLPFQFNQGPRFEVEFPVYYQPVTPPLVYQTAPPTVAHAPQTCRAVADVRTRSLIVRGTAKDLQLAADLVAVIDTAEDKPLPGVTSLKAFRLKHVDAVDFCNMMQQLDTNITYRLVPVGRMKLLLATGSDEQMKELADAVKELDIPAK
jgi:hypothetical protein